MAFADGASRVRSGARPAPWRSSATSREPATLAGFSISESENP
ncbi:hypothetical protein STVIR_4549 [Streptomyces viridochromogenes Tue57]|uniref:Uncharacterized protein n=1 Tax=Streptomyces viridochromogenes Tue57 TaxID=1160705 RepID=L8PDI7_STRVR|nr:hypothetical protein STVIR_4549 [Streptomyces viridochromogenes Tue57]